MATLLGAIPAGQTPQPSGVKLLGNIDQSSATLAHSQQAIDQLRAKQAQAEQASQVANAPATIAKQTATGAIGSLANGALNFVRSAVHAPVDIVNSLRGKPVDQSTAPGFDGQPMKTIQGQAAEMAGNQFDQGQTGQQGPSPVADTANLVGQTVGGAADVLGAKGATEGLGSVLKKPVKAVTSFLEKRAAAKADEQATKASIDAVYNSPTGKKFTQASSQVATGQRQITPASIFKEQGLTPDQQTVNLGTRLKDVKLGADPVKNTETIANEFKNTEDKLQTAFEANKGVSANKQGLLTNLDSVKTDAPQEFRIRDSQAMINRVVDFAKKTLSGAEDEFKSVREARTAFDQQAKHEFPNAFKPDGSVDTKTPAGYAIERARDTINAHLYNTAPNGSEIQSLIGREADLYRAARVSMEKAQAGQGKNWLAQWAKDHPTQAHVLETAGVFALGSTAMGVLKSGD